MTERKLKERKYSIGNSKEVANLLTELQNEIDKGGYVYLLAHLDDGVIWGHVEDKTLQLSSQAFPDTSPKLRPEKLWELRLFGKDQEWRVWQADGELHSCLVTENAGDQTASFDEEYILWGTIADGAPENGFQLVHESNLGITHTPPASVIEGERHSLKLVVRHYVSHDDCGAAYIKISRLVDLKTGGAK